jgi:hypothetical protein
METYVVYYAIGLFSTNVLNSDTLAYVMNWSFDIASYC